MLQKLDWPIITTGSMHNERKKFRMSLVNEDSLHYNKGGTHKAVEHKQEVTGEEKRHFFHPTLKLNMAWLYLVPGREIVTI